MLTQFNHHKVTDVFRRSYAKVTPTQKYVTAKTKPPQEGFLSGGGLTDLCYRTVVNAVLTFSRIVLSLFAADKGKHRERKQCQRAEAAVASAA